MTYASPAALRTALVSGSRQAVELGAAGRPLRPGW